MRSLLILVLAASPVLAQRGDRAGEEQPDLPVSLRIPEAPALGPDEQLATFALAEQGFTIELAAAEPVVVAPVSAVFDEDGRLWVVEMQSYMPNIEGEGELVPTSRVVILEDLDGDGLFDRDTVFLDQLVLPRSVLPCHGGALVLAPPNLLFARDTDGDGRADETEVLLDGFGGLDNPEHAGNGLLYGLDNWIHLSQHGLEIRFDGERVETRPTPAHGQWGITQDDEGRLYYCPNSDVLRADLFAKHYAARNPNQRGVRGMNHDVAPDKSVFPARMTPGINRGYHDHMLRDDFTLARTTAACSPVIYRSAAWGDSFYGDAFTCEPAGNCLMRTAVEYGGAAPVGRRAYTETEFLTSTDERFRPVATAVGPDGSLYVVDMYRGVIQHATYVTSFLRKQVEARGLETPLHMGRIWRISRGGAEARPALRLSDMASAELAELLLHEDAHYREHARKLLIERRETEVSGRVREIALEGDAPVVARVNALWTLEGLGTLTLDDAARAAADAEAAMRAHGRRLLEAWADDAAVVPLLAAEADEPSRAVRVQAALSLGQSRHPEATAELAAMLLRAPADGLLRSAVLSGLHEREAVVLAELASRTSGGVDGALREAMAEIADAALRGSAAQRARYLDLLGISLRDARGFGLVLLERLAAHLRLDGDEPRTLELAEEPLEWTGALRAGLWDVHAAAMEVHGRLRWPGHGEPAQRSAPLAGQDLERYLLGRRLYDTCAACHGFDGRGLQGQAPPLAGSPLVTGPEGAAARVLLHGLEGPIEREGVAYDLQMPAAPFGEDEEIAALLTYIRRAFGNEADPVTPDAVSRIRRETEGRRRPWTEPELFGLESSCTSR